MCMCDRRNCKIQHLSTRSCAERLRGRRKCCEKLSESSNSLKRFVDKGLRFQNIRHRSLKQSLDVLMSPGAFEGRKSEAALMPSNGKSRGPRHQRILGGQDEMQEAAAGHSHLGEEGPDCSGIFHLIRSNQGAAAPPWLFCPTSAGNVVTKHLAALLCLVQMTSRTGAKAAGAAACSAEQGARPAGCHVPVKLPLLPEHR